MFPKILAIYRSIDGGENYTPWYYITQSIEDCDKYFGKGNWVKKISGIDEVKCDYEENRGWGKNQFHEFTIPLFRDYCSAMGDTKKCHSNRQLLNFTQATDVKLSFLAVKRDNYGQFGFGAYDEKIYNRVSSEIFASIIS